MTAVPNGGLVKNHEGPTATTEVQLSLPNQYCLS